MASLNPLAQELNDRLTAAAPQVHDLLSALGRRLYFPKGILTQTAEAKQKAHRFNATIGIATEHGVPMSLPSVMRHFPSLEPAEVVSYAPPAGQPALREAWREKTLAENPSLRGKHFGLPIVTQAITHGLALVGDLFVDPGDKILLPDKLWGNYRLTYTVRQGAEIATFPFYKGSGFDVGAFEAALAKESEGREKLFVLLNFPNNPTGYMPTDAEGDAIADALVRQAERGTKIVAVFDDAYFGLFYHLDGRSMTESIFGRTAGRHPNLFSVRLDGATKELFVWGLRCGFITFAPGIADTADEVCAVLDAKVRGAVRSGISNAPQVSQSVVAKALATASMADERKQKCEILRSRAERVFEVAQQDRFTASWNVYPFNSGYFMCIETKGVSAETVRMKLLDAYGIGTIAAGEHDLRVAFSCLEPEEVEPLFEAAHEAIQGLQ